MRRMASGVRAHHALPGDDGLGTAGIRRGGSNIGLAGACVARLASCAIAARVRELAPLQVTD